MKDPANNGGAQKRNIESNVAARRALETAERNSQLHEYSFTASSSERGQYMLMLSKFSSEL